MMPFRNRKTTTITIEVGGGGEEVETNENQFIAIHRPKWLKYLWHLKRVYKSINHKYIYVHILPNTKWYILLGYLYNAHTHRRGHRHMCSGSSHIQRLPTPLFAIFLFSFSLILFGFIIVFVVVVCFDLHCCLLPITTAAAIAIAAVNYGICIKFLWWNILIYILVILMAMNVEYAY